MKQIDIEFLRDLFKDYPGQRLSFGASFDWDDYVIVSLSQHGAEQTLRTLCGPDITLATVLTLVSRSDLASLVESLELRINTYAMGHETGHQEHAMSNITQRSIASTGRLPKPSSGTTLSVSMTRYRTNTRCSA